MMHGAVMTQHARGTHALSKIEQGTHDSPAIVMLQPCTTAVTQRLNAL